MVQITGQALVALPIQGKEFIADSCFSIELAGSLKEIRIHGAGG